jgi:hypothetical protein
MVWRELVHAHHCRNSAICKPPITVAYQWQRSWNATCEHVPPCSVGLCLPGFWIISAFGNMAMAGSRSGWLVGRQASRILGRWWAMPVMWWEPAHAQHLRSSVTCMPPTVACQWQISWNAACGTCSPCIYRPLPTALLEYRVFGVTGAISAGPLHALVYSGWAMMGRCWRAGAAETRS